MASRLYRTTRPLYLEVIRQLRQLGIGVVGTPATFALIALYISGLILLDRHPTQTRVSRFLPARCHDAINRLLRVMPLSSRALMGSLICWVRRRGVQGYLCLDDVVIEKAFAKRLAWAGWTYSLPRSARFMGYTWWSFCGAAAMGDGVSPWLSVCGVPSTAAARTPTARTPTGPSSS
jgi:hypothetical protein